MITSGRINVTDSVTCLRAKIDSRLTLYLVNLGTHANFSHLAHKTWT